MKTIARILARLCIWAYRLGGGLGAAVTLLDRVDQQDHGASYLGAATYGDAKALQVLLGVVSVDIGKKLDEMKQEAIEARDGENK